MTIQLMFLMLALYTGETVDGLNKICYYQSPKGTHAITINSYQICPRSIQV